MRASLWVLAYLLLMCSPWLVAGCSFWRRSRQRRRGVVPVFHARRPRTAAEAALEARLSAVKDAERTVRAAYERVGGLYEEPSVVRTAELIVAAEWARSISER